MKIILINAMWSPNSLKANKILEKIQQKNPQIEWKRFDYDMDREAVTYYNISNMVPIFIILNNDNQEITRFYADKEEDEIIALIENIYQKIN